MMGREESSEAGMFAGVGRVDLPRAVARNAEGDEQEEPIDTDGDQQSVRHLLG
jgi:hypothetical protein